MTGVVVYVCDDCRNCVTEAQVRLVTVPHLNVAIALDGEVLCASAKHAMAHPVMRRVEVDA